MKKIYFFVISFSLHSLLFSTVELHLDKKDTGFLSCVFWGDIFSPQEPLLFTNTRTYTARPLHFVKFPGIKTMLEAPPILYKKIDSRLPYERFINLTFAFPWKPSAFLSFRLASPLRPHLKEVKFLLFISKEGYVKMAMKLNSTGDISIDRFLERKLRNIYFQTSDEAYSKIVSVRLK